MKAVRFEEFIFGFIRGFINVGVFAEFGASSLSMFLGIQFQDCAGGDIALIHKKWLTPRKSEVWWPPYKIQDTFDKALKGESLLDNWELYKVGKTLFEEALHSGLHHSPVTPSASQKSKTGNSEESQISNLSTQSPRFELVPQLSAVKDPQNCGLLSASQVGCDEEPAPQGNFSGAVLSGTNANEREVEDAIKSWLKQKDSEKRLIDNNNNNNNNVFIQKPRGA